MQKYTTILFDLNGVLILNAPNYISSELEQTIYKRLGTSLDDISEKSKLLNELGWDEDKFWDYDKNAWKGAVPNLELLQKIKDLKNSGYRLGLVTNTSGLVLRKNELEFFGFYLNDLFDTVVISSEVHMLKPEKEIYQLTLDNLKADPSETIFVDDSNRYLRGAEVLGITPLLYVENKQVISELEKLGVKANA